MAGKSYQSFRYRHCTFSQKWKSCLWKFGNKIVTVPWWQWFYYDVSCPRALTFSRPSAKCDLWTNRWVGRLWENVVIHAARKHISGWWCRSHLFFSVGRVFSCLGEYLTNLMRLGIRSCGIRTGRSFPPDPQQITESTTSHRNTTTTN